MHNFIRSHQLQEEIYDREQRLAERENALRAASELDPLEDGTRANTAKGDGRRMNEFRDKIAEQMWQDYIRG